MKSFYLCLCDRKKLFEGDTLKCESYTQNINIPIAYHNEEFSSYNEFPTRDILPEAVRNTLLKTCMRIKCAPLSRQIILLLLR